MIGKCGVVLDCKTTRTFVDRVAKGTWRWTKEGTKEKTYDFNIEEVNWQLVEDEKSKPET